MQERRFSVVRTGGHASPNAACRLYRRSRAARTEGDLWTDETIRIEDERAISLRVAEAAKVPGAKRRGGALSRCSCGVVSAGAQ